jgi:hypothetical protein
MIWCSPAGAAMGPFGGKRLFYHGLTVPTFLTFSDIMVQMRIKSNKIIEPF